MAPISALDIPAQRARLGDALYRRINKVLEHGRFIMGPETTELERALAVRSGVAHVVSCGSGTDALLMPLMAWGIGPGDAVITTPFTFIATAEVISLLGATPVFVDIDEATFNIDPALIEPAIAALRREGRLTPRVIVPVDMFGLPADYDRIRPVAERHGLKLLADAAQSFGGELKNSAVGSFGDATGVSFFPSKPLGCYGDGGAILTDDAELADALRSIRMHGKGDDKYDNVRIGLNSRLDTLQAAVLLAKLALFDDELARRDAIANRYSAALKSCITVPTVSAEARSAWAQYSILSERRDALAAALAKAAIPTTVYYPRPLHLQTAFERLGYHQGDFPVSESVSERVLSLPMHPYLTDEQVDHVIAAVVDFAASPEAAVTAP